MTIKDYYDKQFDYRGQRIDYKRMNRWLKYVPFGSGLSMLDVGCGIGDSAEWARWHKMEWLGVDVSITAATIAKTIDRDVWNIDAQQMPFQSNAFDIVIALGSIEHIENPQRALHEMYRVLKPCGHAVIVVPNRPIIESWGLYRGTDQPYELRLTKQGWHEMITDAWFTIRKVRRDYGPPVFKDSKPVKIIQRLMVKLTRFLPDCFAYTWIFDCQKGVRFGNRKEKS